MAMLSYFPGGAGASKLGITAYAAAGSLPASADEGALAVITATAINAAYASAEMPAAPAAGDVWVWTGGQSLAPICFSQEVTLFPRACYQYDGTGWTLLDSYVYTSDAWAEVTLAIYDSGSDFLGVLQETDTGGLNTNYIHFVRQETAINFYGSSGSLYTRKYCV